MRIAVARHFRKLPHELGHLPLTYYQTLVNNLIEARSSPLTRNDDGDENGDVASVDVDALIRKGQTSGFGVSG